MQKALWFAVVLLAVGVAIFAASKIEPARAPSPSPSASAVVDTYEECVAAGGKIFYSNPPACEMPNGQAFYERELSAPLPPGEEQTVY